MADNQLLFTCFALKNGETIEMGENNKRNIAWSVLYHKVGKMKICPLNVCHHYQEAKPEGV